MSVHPLPQLKTIISALALSALGLTLSLNLTACINGSEDQSPPEPNGSVWESQQPGDCSDGADNDGDGLFDCNDPDCMGSSECLPGDDDDSAGQGDDDTGEDDDNDSDCVDNDGDNWCADEDCDDLDASASPIGIEVCDGVDNNCNDLVDDSAVNALTWYLDADNDGYGAAHISVMACEAPDGFVENQLDCNDLEARSYPGGEELCDLIDNNCDGNIDEGQAAPSTWYADFDGDGYGNPDSSVLECQAPASFIDSAGDCDDLNPAANPAATEVCDLADNNCDGSIDEGAAAPPTWHADFDGDGHPSATVTVIACSVPGGYLPAASTPDCDDLDGATFPGAPELCDGIDNDCTGGANIGGLSGSEADDDGDGFAECEGDCNDSDVATFPGAIEDCAGSDLNCDGDESAGAIGGELWQADLDGDGFGGSTLTQNACSQPQGYVLSSLGTDCDDLQQLVYPGAAELCDGIDNDCDPSTVAGGSVGGEADTDNDGQRPCGGDCDDTDPANFSGNPELCDGQDNDCNGSADIDGAGSESDDDGDLRAECEGDCDDSPGAGASIFPGAAELCDAIDSDCNDSIVDNFDDTDGDQVPDCVDLDDDEDGDPDSSDCNDTDDSIFTGATEVCDAIDSDCDTQLNDAGEDDCDNNATCTVSNSPPSCVCNSGFQGNGNSCQPIPSFDGTVLLNTAQQEQLNSWFAGPGTTWTLCYRKSTHGASSSTFHNRCNGFSPTLSIAQMSNGRLMGGYAGSNWSGSGYNSGSGNYLFSLTSTQRWGCTSTPHCQYNHNGHGPTFGGGHDWYVDSSMNSGYCNSGHSYSGCNENTLCGGYSGWSISELEVWYR